MKKISTLIILLSVACIFDSMAHASGQSVTDDLWIRAVINTLEKGPVEAVWKKGGSDTTEAGHHVIWGYFYADPENVSWGSPNNPDLYVKIWFDMSGRIDVNFFHVSVPDIEVCSDYPHDGICDQSGTVTMDNRYIRQEYQATFPETSGIFTGTDSGRTVILQAGGMMSVSLPSHQGDEWGVRSSDKYLLRQTGSTFRDNCPSHSDMSECEGEEVWTFEAVSAGETQLVMACPGKWENSADETFVLNVRIQSEPPTVFWESDSGKTAVLQAGSSFDIILPANPSTGYEWDISTSDQHTLGERGHAHYSACQSESGSPECGGEDVWSFEAAAPGTAQLEMRYSHPSGDDGETGKTFVLNVQVETEFPNVLTEADNGKTALLQTASPMKLVLPTEPAEGYEWEIKTLDHGVLKQTGSIHHSGCPWESDVLQCQGNDIWSFEAVNPGTTELEMVYQQASAGEGSSLKSFFSNVQVQSEVPNIFRDDDNGRTVVLQTGISMSVILKSNPLTGYGWKIKSSDDEILQQTGKAYNSACPSDTDRVGCGGEDVWDFRTVGNGMTQLEMIYYRPWEGEASKTKTFILNVYVRSEAPNVFTDADNGKTVTLPPDSLISIILKSNPSTGYEWELGALDENMLQKISSEYNSACPSDTDIAGCGGEEIWDFRILGNGVTQLEMRYKREGEISVAKTFTLNIRIQSDLENGRRQSVYLQHSRVLLFSKI